MRSVPLMLLLACLSGCSVQCSTKKGRSRSNPLSFQGGGAESWVIQGKTYQIKHTYYAKTGSTLAYTIEYMPAMLPDLPDDTDLIAALAFPVAEHAYKNQLYKRLKVSKVGQGSLKVSAIRVALIPPAGCQSPGRGISWSLKRIAEATETGPVTGAPGSTPRRDRPYRVAMFDLAPAGNAPPEKWIGVGVAASLRGLLLRVPELVPVPGSLLPDPAGTKADGARERRVVELAQASRCDCVVLGTCSATGEALRFDLRTFDGSTGKLLAETTVDGSKHDLLGSLPKLASSLVAALLEAARDAGMAPEGADGPHEPSEDAFADWGTKDPVAYEEWCRAMGAQDPRDRLRWLTAAIERDAKYADAYLERGAVYCLADVHSPAIADYDRAIRLRPDSAGAYANRAISKLALRDVEGALKDCGKAIELNPRLAMAYTARGMALRVGGRDLGEQEKAFTRALGLVPLLPDAHAYRGAVRFDLRKLRGSIEDENLAIELRPACVEAYKMRGVASLTVGDLTGAVRDLSRVIEMRPSDKDAYRCRGGALYLQGKNSAALADLRKAKEMGMQVDPDFLQRVARHATEDQQQR